MSKPRRGDVVEVEWVDSEQLHLGWATPKEHRKAARAPQGYRTAGYWMGRTGGQVVIALSADPKNGNVSGAMSIPLVAVGKVTVLGRADKRVRKALA